MKNYSIFKAGSLVDEEERALWEKWTRTQDPNVLAQIMTLLRPLIKSQTRKYYSAPIPRSAIDAEGYNLAMKALETYNPSFGASISTHVMSYLRKLQRFTLQNQNVSRISERVLSNITVYKNGVAELEEMLGRTPTSNEVADYLHWPLAQVKSMELNLKRDIMGGDTESEELGTNIFGGLETPGTHTLLPYIYNDLSDEERDLFQKITGYPSGAPKSLASISKETGIPYYELRKKKDDINKKIEKFFYMP